MARRVKYSPIDDLSEGQKIAIQYIGEPLWHERLLIHRASQEVAKSLHDFEADFSTAWWVITPDGDIYPEPLGEDCLEGMVRLERGRAVRGTMKPSGKALGVIYGFADSGLELDLNTVLKASKAALDEELGARNRRQEVR